MFRLWLYVQVRIYAALINALIGFECKRKRRDGWATWGDTNTPATNRTSQTHWLLPSTKVRDTRMDHGTGNHSPAFLFLAIFILTYTSLRIFSDPIAGWSVTIPLRSFPHGSYCVPLFLWIIDMSVPCYRAISHAFVFYHHSQVLHLGQAIRYRTWWLLPTACFCGVIELLGWSGRLWSSISPLLTTPYQIQWVELVLVFLHVTDQVVRQDNLYHYCAHSTPHREFRCSWRHDEAAGFWLQSVEPKVAYVSVPYFVSPWKIICTPQIPGFLPFA